MAAAGYSLTPLAKKLGLKPGFLVKFINPPDYYWTLFTNIPDDLISENDTSVKKNFIHCFFTAAKDLFENLPHIRQELLEDGMIWVSWYKSSSGIKTDITEDVVRDFALKIGLVDIKVCAIDEKWSGLKLVIPVKDRLKKL
ncbi:MAG: DUF3052 family protein [Chitinophagaceae bacterium]|nr:MAG: DUF3052 family protein [Chitinophagaceae bacterium]